MAVSCWPQKPSTLEPNLLLAQLTSAKVFFIKGSLGGETSVLRTFRMSGKELVKERVSKERVRQGKS